MTHPGQFSTSRRPDGTTVLTVTGEIDMSNADAFTEALTTALADTTGTLVVDLTDLHYLDSAGLTTLFQHAARLELVAPPRLNSLLTISGLPHLTTVHITDPAGSPD